jgi:3-phenylpropionate/trans-cinnamate dioxygenase alpha subunit
MYHAPISHASAIMALVPPDGPEVDPSLLVGVQFSSDRGHGCGFWVDGDATFGEPTLSKYLSEVRPEIAERLGDIRARGPVTSGHHTIFPNFSYLPGIQTIRVWHPRGPHEMEVWAWTLVDAEAPPEVKEAQRLYTLRTFGPSGMLEQDDGENWGEIQRNASSVIASRHPWNYQMGLNRTAPDDRFPGRTDYVMSEMAARGFYREWARLMTSAPGDPASSEGPPLQADEAPVRPAPEVSGVR